MILTCPECSTKYMSKDGSIGPNGRSVRCARCQTVWFIEGFDPEVLALEDNQLDLLVVEENPQDKLPPVPKIVVPPSIGAHVLLRDKADAVKLAKRRQIIRMIWMLPLSFLLGAAIIAMLKRQTVVEKFPRTATLYQTLGFDVKANGLDLRGLQSENLIVDGESILRVTGEVVNLTSKAIMAPLIQLRLENRSGEALADWFVEAGNIAAHKSIKIETDYPAPPIDGVELRYRFVPDE